MHTAGLGKCVILIHITIIRERIHLKHFLCAGIEEWVLSWWRGVLWWIRRGCSQRGVAEWTTAGSADDWWGRLGYPACHLCMMHGCTIWNAGRGPRCAVGARVHPCPWVGVGHDVKVSISPNSTLFHNMNLFVQCLRENSTTRCKVSGRTTKERTEFKLCKAFAPRETMRAQTV